MTENEFRNMNDSIMNKFTEDIGNETNPDVIARMIEEFGYFSCKPDEEKYPCVASDAILDENKSVKWNREQAKRLRDSYFAKSAEYSQLKGLLVDKCEKRLITLLGESYGFSFKESKRIWDYVFGNFHSGGIFEVKSCYYDIADLYNELLAIRKNSERE